MYQEKIARSAAMPTATPADAESVMGQMPRSTARIRVALIVAALPALAVWLLAHFLWRDVKAVLRGIGAFCDAAAQELSRS